MKSVLARVLTDFSSTATNNSLLATFAILHTQEHQFQIRAERAQEGAPDHGTGALRTLVCAKYFSSVLQRLSVPVFGISHRANYVIVILAINYQGF